MTEATVEAGAIATAVEFVRGEVIVVPPDDVVVIFVGRWVGISR